MDALQDMLKRSGLTVDDPRVTPVQMGLPPREQWGQLPERGVGDVLGNVGLSDIPVLGAVPAMLDFSALKIAADELEAERNEEKTLTSDARALYTDIVGRFVTQAQYEQARGKTFPAEITEVLKMMVPLMAEMSLTGGASAAARAVTKKAGQKVLGKAAERGIGKVAMNVAGFTAGGTGRFASVPGVASAGAEYTKRQALFDESPATSALKAAGDTWIEYVTEESGAVLGKGAKAVVSKIPGAKALGDKMSKALAKVWVKSGKSKSRFQKLFEDAQYHNILEELGEERFGAALRVATGVDPNADIIPTAHDFAVELAAFSVPGAVRAAGSTALDVGDRLAELHQKVPSQARTEPLREPEAIEEPAPAPKKPKMPAKADLLTPEGAKAWAAENPALAELLGPKKDPSRREFSRELRHREKWRADERAQFTALLRGEETAPAVEAPTTETVDAGMTPEDALHESDPLRQVEELQSLREETGEIPTKATAQRHLGLASREDAQRLLREAFGPDFGEERRLDETLAKNPVDEMAALPWGELYDIGTPLGVKKGKSKQKYAEAVVRAQESQPAKKVKPEIVEEVAEPAAEPPVKREAAATAARMLTLRTSPEIVAQVREDHEKSGQQPTQADVVKKFGGSPQQANRVLFEAFGLEREIEETGKVPTKAEIAKRYGVSVREASRMLKRTLEGAEKQIPLIERIERLQQQYEETGQTPTLADVVHRFGGTKEDARRLLYQTFGAEFAAEQSGKKKDEVSEPDGKSAAQVAQEEADARPVESADQLGIIPRIRSIFGKRKPIRDDRIGEEQEEGLDELAVKNPEIEKRLEKAHGVKPSTLREWFSKHWTDIRQKTTRPQEFLAITGENAVANEFFRLLKVIPESTADEVKRTVTAIIDPLGKRQLRMFERRIIAANLLASVDREEPLRFGFESREEVAQYLAQVDALVRQTPAVQKALATREKVVKELVEELVEYGILDQKNYDQAESYYHQQVLMHVDAQNVPGSTGGARTKKRNFQRRRVKGVDILGEWADYNTSYIESEFVWMAESRQELEKEKLLQDLDHRYGILDQLKREAKDQNFENLVGGLSTVRKIERLRGQIAESLAGEDSQDSAERLARKGWHEELEEIDPTHAYRREIALKQRLLDQDLKKNPHILEGSAFEEYLNRFENDEEEGQRVFNEPDGDFFGMLEYILKNHPETFAGANAAGIFKTISARQKMMEETLGDDFLTWKRLVDQNEDYAAWQPDPGHHFYQAYSIPEKIAEAIQQMAFADQNLKPEQVQTVMAIGADKRSFVLPTHIVKQLMEMEKPNKTGMVSNLVEGALTGWKQYTLLNPKRFIGYSLRNMTGDMDAVIAGAPGVWRSSGQAWKELRKMYRGDLSLSDTLREARDLGVVSSGMTSHEIADLKDTAEFERLLNADKPNWNLIYRWFDLAKGANELRENWLRYASYLHFKKELQAGTLKHYAGSKREVVDALREEMGVDEAAAHLARNLLGDYGDMTVFGDYLRRKSIPFWSWNEINLKRYPRMIRNAVQAGQKGQAAIPAAILTAKYMSRLAYMYGALWVWNNLINPDPEDELSRYDRANPHVNLWRNDDGTMTVFRNVGALGDYMEWFGFNSLMSLAPEFFAEQITGTDIAGEIWKDPFNKIAGGWNPLAKTTIETMAGMSAFPDAFQWRTVDRWEHAFGLFGLQEEARGVRGLVTGDGSTMRPNYLQRWVTGVVDPRRTAIHQMYDLRAKFLKKQGKAIPSFGGTSPFKNIREAGYNGNYEAFKKARRTYLKSGKTYENFKRSLGYLDPIASRLKDEDEIKFETEFLTGQQRKRLKIARDFAHNTKVKLFGWWRDAAQDDTPAEQIEYDQEVRRDVGLLLYRVSGPSAEPHKIKAGIRDLREMYGVTDTQLLRLLKDHVIAQAKRSGRKRPNTNVWGGPYKNKRTALGERWQRLQQNW